MFSSHYSLHCTSAYSASSGVNQEIVNTTPCPVGIHFAVRVDCTGTDSTVAFLRNHWPCRPRTTYLNSGSLALPVNVTFASFPRAPCNSFAQCSIGLETAQKQSWAHPSPYTSMNLQRVREETHAPTHKHLKGPHKQRCDETSIMRLIARGNSGL